jgi:hypothetical protein
MMRPTLVNADSTFAGVQFSARADGFWAFDTKTGDVWMYQAAADFPAGRVIHIGRITALGKPLVK